MSNLIGDSLIHLLREKTKTICFAKKKEKNYVVNERIKIRNYLNNLYSSFRNGEIYV